MKEAFNVVLFLTFVVAAMLHGSSAQTTHVVGGALGWTVPPGGDVAYRTWAATIPIFRVGDVLVFNFTTGAHDVAEVSRTAYDSCNINSPIAIYNNGPARVNLTSAGEHHFICTVGSHCTLGQRLTINVSSASAPSPQPSPAPMPAAAAPGPSAPVPAATPPMAAGPSPTIAAGPSPTIAAGPSPTIAAGPSPSIAAGPSPTMAAGPSPSSVRNTYTVGNELGWTVPPGGQMAYQTWAATIRSFMVGDILLFNFTTGQHDVVEVSREDYDRCSTTTPPITTGPAMITLNSTGEHHFICTVGRHCSLGQRLAINVTGTGGGPTMAPPSSPLPPVTPSPVTAPPPPSSSATSFAVAGLPFTFLTIALAFLV